MKRTIIYIIAILSFVLPVGAQTNELKQANESYSKRNFGVAAKQYEEIIKKVGVAPELYYNLGNAYYKLNETGLSILNYERALKLAPNYSDAKFNLEIAQLKVVDDINQVPTFFLDRWVDRCIELLNSNQWFYVSISTFILCLMFAFFFVFGPTRQFRKMSFYFAVGLISFSCLSVIFANVRKNQLLSSDEAIIMVGVVTAKSSPDKSGTDLFQLHEGTKVDVKSSLGDWIEITLGNGSIGWVEAVNVQKI